MSGLPDWPAMMRRSTAASYCDLSEPEFEREISAGRLPRPIKLGNRDHWSRAQLDKMLAILTGEAAYDFRKGSPLYRDKAA